MRVFIVHGWEASPDDDWFRWLETELTKKGFSVSVPEMPNTNNPKMSSWVKFLAETVKSCDEDTFFVGHSLGCITIIRYLESLDAKQGAGGAVFVAGFSDISFKELSSFIATPVNWKKVRKNCKSFVVINSDNDPVVPIEEAKNLEENLSAKLIVKHLGHFNADDGVTELPDVLEALLKMAKR